MMAPHTSEAARSDPTPSPFTGEGGGGGLPSHDTHTAQPSQPLSTGGITVTVNGEERRLPRGTAIATPMTDVDTLGSAIARNREVVPRSHWDEVLLTDGDTIEVVRPTQGG